MTTDLYAHKSNADLLHSALTRYSDRIAFIDGARQFTYAQSAAAVQVLRDKIRTTGISQGDASALLAGNHPETFFARTASAMEGTRNTALHPENGVDDHVHALTFAEIDILMYESPRFDVTADQLAEHIPGLKLLAITEMTPDPTALHGVNCLSEPVRIAPDDIVGIGFSGGTTGAPKGIAHYDKTVLTNALYTVIEWEWPIRPKFLVTTPLSHATGAMTCPILLQGGTMVMMDKFSPAGFVDAVETHDINSTFLVPTMIYRILDLEGLDDARLRSLETVIYGASLITPSRLREAIGRFGQIFVQLYGQSEAPNLVTVLRKGDHDPSDLDRLSSCGQVVSCAEVKLLDDQNSEVSPGEVGEICVRGPIVMAGYWKRPDLTEEAFSDGWLHTGDLAKFGPDGYLAIVGRKKDMVITGGLNVYPSEIEAVICEHPGVAVAAVVGVPDPDWGERLVGFVVPAETGSSLTSHQSLTDNIKSFVKDRKGSVQTPKDVFEIDAIPVTNIGKPDKNQLVEMAESLVKSS